MNGASSFKTLGVIVCKGLTSVYLKTKGKHMYIELPCGVWDHCWQTASVGMRKQY
jgi:hypothetical protein